MSRILSCLIVVGFTLFAATEADARRRDRPPPAASASVGLRPHGGPLGLGLQLGSPTGLAGKYYLTNDQGLSFALGFGGHNWFGGHVDYVWAPISLVSLPIGTLYPYFGGGLFAGFGSVHFPAYAYFPGLYGWLGLGLEIPIGLAFNFGALPLDAFLELAPGASIFPGIGFGLRGSIGLRYYF